MGEVVSLEDYKAKHSRGYIRGVILDSKVDRTPEKPPTRYGWNKEESDKNVAEGRKRANESVVPDGPPIDLPAGTPPRISQAPGSSFTLFVHGQLMRLRGADAHVQFGQDVKAHRHPHG